MIGHNGESGDSLPRRAEVVERLEVVEIPPIMEVPPRGGMEIVEMLTGVGGGEIMEIVEKIGKRHVARGEPPSQNASHSGKVRLCRDTMVGCPLAPAPPFAVSST